MKMRLEQMALSLVESGGYHVTSRPEPQTEYHSLDNIPKLVAAILSRGYNTTIRGRVTVRIRQIGRLKTPYSNCVWAVKTFEAGCRSVDASRFLA